MNINVNSSKIINCEMYKKPTDTGVVLNLRCSAPIQYKWNIVEETVHRVLRSTGTWNFFDKAVKEENENTWPKNQYSESWTSKIINGALLKIINKPQLKNEGKKFQLRGQKLPAKSVKPSFFLQHRGNISLQLKQKFKKIAN